MTTPPRQAENPSQGGRRARRALLWLPSLAAVLMASIMALEVSLQIRASRRDAAQETELTPLERAYYPFSIQHLHPQYLFFFPLDPAERVAIGNPVCSLDRDGYREPGPAHAGGRKLAVLLGGSAAFGYLSTSNETTITSYLNRLQSEYFFVNAGVPSWNSTQELFRLAVEIDRLRPAVVISYDGGNDARLANVSNARGSAAYPGGTPESFDRLDALVGDLRAPQNLLSLPRLFPELRHRLEKYGYLTKQSGPEIGMEATARQYLSNQAQMAALSAGIGARFINIFQPVAYMHEVGKALVDNDTVMARFHRLVSTAPVAEHRDFSAIFDDVFAAAAAAGKPLERDSVFQDDVHLTDWGNELIAERLWRVVQQPAGHSAH